MRWPRVPSGSMQQEADRRLPQSRKLHARALPAARHRRDGEGALLRHQLLVDRAAQSHGHHPEGNAGRLHRAARSRPACELGRETHFFSLVGADPDVGPVPGLVVFLRSSYLGWPMCFLVLVDEPGDPFSIAFAGVNKFPSFNSIGGTAPLYIATARHVLASPITPATKTAFIAEAS